MMKEINVALLGHGTVGSGVAEILTGDAARLAGLAGKKINLRYILDKRSFPKAKYQELFTKDIEVILGDGKVDVVAEAMGGVSPAYEWCLRALESGKSVVTSNKELVCEKGTELLEAAGKHNVSFLFEASVGGGMPCLHMAGENMKSSGITSVMGILNGTTNYILSKMADEGVSYDSALAEAQKLGYAEADPTADVKGYDAARKIAIMSSMIWGSEVRLSDVAALGIDTVTGTDMQVAKSLGLTVKLVASASADKKGRVTASVMPTLVDNKSPLAKVSGCDNIVSFITKTNSPVTVTGAGAGKMATASAVVSDICDIALGKAPYADWKKSEGAAVPTSEYKGNFLFAVPTHNADALKELLRGLSVEYRLQPSPPVGGYLLMVSNLGLTGLGFLKAGLKKFGAPYLGYPVIM